MIERLKKLTEHQGFMKYFKNTSWLFAEKILRMVVGLFVGIWVARYLGPDRFGLLSYAQAFVGLFAAVASLGLDGIVVRELVKHPHLETKLLSTAFILKLIGAVLTLIFLAVAVNFTSNDTYTNMLVFIIASAVIFKSFNVIDLYFQAKVMSKYVVYANSMALLLSSAIKIYLVLNKAPLEAFAWMVLFDAIIMALGYLYWFWKIKKDFFILHLQMDWQLAKTLLSDSWPLIFSSIVVAIYMRIDQVMIKEMLDAEAVGNYAAAVRLSEAWYFIPMVISSSLFPAIINAKKISEELYYNRLQKLYDLMVMVAVVIAIPTTFLSSWIIALLYGKEYIEASSVLMIHIWAGVFVGLGVASSRWFIAENLQIHSLYRTLSGVIINILLNYFLIPLFSIYGAAIATLISQIAASYLFNIFTDKTFVTYKLQSNALLIPLRKLGVFYK